MECAIDVVMEKASVWLVTIQGGAKEIWFENLVCVWRATCKLRQIFKPRHWKLDCEGQMTRTRNLSTFLSSFTIASFRSIITDSGTQCFSLSQISGQLVRTVGSNYAVYRIDIASFRTEASQPIPWKVVSREQMLRKVNFYH